MADLQKTVQTVTDATGNITDAVTKLGIDLELENIGGLFSNLTLLSTLLVSLVQGRSPPKLRKKFKDEYDYIVVGGGSAGSVMAGRLSENPCISVLLLEAGGEPPILTEVPGYARLFYGSPIDWQYRTTPQKYGAFGQNENRVILNNGKMLGGSSGLNAMLYVRGNMKNYDEWEKEGASGWSYKDVLPFFLKLEDNRNMTGLDQGYHRVGGPLTVEYANYTPEIKDPILEAMRDMGFQLRDINGERQTGAYYVQGTLRNQQRCSGNKAFLDPAKDRENLDILTYAYAKKVLITRKKRRAYAVEFDHGHKTHVVRARREIILCNGAIKTPQILMLSGIGPKEQLDKFNITPIAYLPVGKNLQDHYSSHLVYTISETIMPVVLKVIDPVNILEYITNRKGILTCPTEVTVMAFLDGINTTKNSPDFPRQEIYFGEYTTIDPLLTMNVEYEVWEKVYAPYVAKSSYICFACLLQPYSVGEVTLSSTDPHDDPLINPNYYQDERDLEDVIKGMKICNAVAEHPAMRKVNAKLLDTFKSGYPNCTQYEGDEDKHLGCIARSLINTFWHYTGTARMGARDDPRSVVDPQLRVIGVRGLRVVNAAVMPIIPSGNTNVPTMMIAEKAYDMMKDSIKCRQ